MHSNESKVATPIDPPNCYSKNHNTDKFDSIWSECICKSAPIGSGSQGKRSKYENVSATAANYTDQDADYSIVNRTTNNPLRFCDMQYTHRCRQKEYTNPEDEDITFCRPRFKSHHVVSPFTTNFVKCLDISKSRYFIPFGKQTISP